MKIKPIICLLFLYQSIVISQESKKRPSWTNEMPARNDVPVMKVESDKSESFQIDRSSLDFDRDSMFSSDDTELQSEELQEKNLIKKSTKAAKRVKVSKLETQIEKKYQLNLSTLGEKLKM